MTYKVDLPLLLSYHRPLPWQPMSLYRQTLWINFYHPDHSNVNNQTCSTDLQLCFVILGSYALG